MPYNPGIQYRGDLFLNRAIANAGSSIADAMIEYRKQKDESAFLDAQVEGLAGAAKKLVDSGDLEPELIEEFKKFSGQSLAKKRGMAANALFRIQMANQQADRAAARSRDMANLELNRGRLLLEAGREGRASAQDARFADYNRRMAEYLQTPEMLRRPGMEEAIAAQAGVGTPEATLDRQKMEEARRPPFTPSIVTVDGRRFVTTSNNSAIPLPALSSGDLPVEPWMLAEDREAFLREIQKLPREAALEVLNLRRQARPEEYRSTNPIDALFAAQNGGRGVFPAGPAGKKQLDDATARRFLNEAKGDRARARELARQAGYEW